MRQSNTKEAFYRSQVRGHYHQSNDPWVCDDPRFIKAPYVEEVKPKEFKQNPKTLSVPLEVEKEFYAIYNDWQARTGHRSIGRFTDAAYYELIGLGTAILPLVFREFEKKPSNWFCLLSALARRDEPTFPPEVHGRVREIAKIWIEWAKARRYV